MNVNRILERARTSPASLRFGEARALAEALGFGLSRVSGSHHIFTCPGVPALLNLQDVRGMAKAYQIRQLLRLAGRYNLTIRG